MSAFNKIRLQQHNSPQKQAYHAQTGHLDAVSSRRFLENHPSTIVLDVRTETEVKDGYIVAAHFLDFRSPHFTRRIKNLDPEKTYLVHCNDSDRSLLAFNMLKDLGFKHVLHMDGGLNAWKAAGLPVSVPY